MADVKRPGPLGGPTNNPAIDPSTLCRGFTPSPGPVDLALAAMQSLAIKGPLLVGKAKRDPGLNFDGSPAEDMMSGDQPTKSASIKSDPVFSESDGQLAAYLRQLMTSLSIGDMETVAVEMQEKFCGGAGGTYSSKILDAEIADNSAFAIYHYHFYDQLKDALKKNHFDPTQITVIPMSLLNFSSFWDKVSGLGITIHQVWSAKAELENYSRNCITGFWSANLVYTLYDHYGLDWEDIVKHGDDHLPQYHTGDFFKAWYILQHYRKAKPFITVMKRNVFIAGNLG